MRKIEVRAAEFPTTGPQQVRNIHRYQARRLIQRLALPDSPTTEMLEDTFSVKFSEGADFKTLYEQFRTIRPVLLMFITRVDKAINVEPKQ